MIKAAIAIAALVLLAACEPSDRRPGLWLSGPVQQTLPADWSFTNEHPEIFLEVSTPYLLPHSVTIWCAELDGNLYLGARAPETKRWPGWVDDDPDVRIKVAGDVYPVTLEPLTESASITAAAAAYAAKYDLSGGLAGGDPAVGQRYWVVRPRA